MEKVYGSDAFITVRLNGLSQTTDRLAMREIARQLSNDGALDESGDFVRSHLSLARLISSLLSTDLYLSIAL